MLLAAHALAAGPLAASQPGFTILDPLAASLLGVFLFGEHIQTDAGALAGEALALAVVIAGAATLSRSCLILGEDQHPACPDQPTPSRAADTPTGSQSPRADPRARSTSRRPGSGTAATGASPWSRPAPGPRSSRPSR